MLATAFVGCAHIHTPEFARMAATHPAVEVRAAWDHEAWRAETIADELGAAVAGEPSEIWRDAAIEAVFICAETARQRELAERALAARKHIFVEKPLATGGPDAMALAAEVERAGVQFQTGYFMRGQAVHRALRKALAEGRLGRVTRIRATNSNPAALEGWFDDERWRWMADTARAGFGGFGDEGAHAVDLVLWMLGHPRVEEVTARLGSATGRYGPVDEFGEALLRLDGGVLACVGAGWADRDARTALEVYGTSGHARIDQERLYMSDAGRAGADDAPARSTHGPDLPHAFELFLDALARRGEAPLVPAREAAATTAVLDAAYRAARLGGWAEPVREPRGSEPGSRAAPRRGHS